VLTPHEGEFHRLFPDLGQGSKLSGPGTFPARIGAVVVLKGPDTVIAAWTGAHDQRECPPWLATAGSGDVPAASSRASGAKDAGFRGGLRRRVAARRGGGAVGPGLIAEDLPERLPEVLRRLQRGMDR
jgi:NAD(P)H-hydrate epimerase